MIGAAGPIFIADHRRRNALHCEAMLREPTTNVELDVRQSQILLISVEIQRDARLGLDPHIARGRHRGSKPIVQPRRKDSPVVATTSP